jgi:hypothetical protein
MPIPYHSAIGVLSFLGGTRSMWLAVMGHALRGTGTTTKRGGSRGAAAVKSEIATPADARQIGYEIGRLLFTQGCSDLARNYYRTMFLGSYDLHGDKRRAWIRGFDAGYQGRPNRLGKNSH